MRIKPFGVYVLLLAFIGHLAADGADGMWLPHQARELRLAEQGLALSADDLFREDGTGLMSAVVHLGGGTGSFVSAEGLILTNHHVAFGAIQRASSTANDYITKGFLAADRATEIPAQGYIADVLLGYTDVTDRVEAAIGSTTAPLARFQTIDRVTKEIVAEIEAGGPDLRGRVAAMYSGLRYYAFRFKRLRDIRLVYAPPQDIGNFGGDIDNWMWPRHTGDFTFLRAYVAADGTGAAHDPANVPYQPQSFLKIARQGVQDGDLTFVIGYPGTTYRNYTQAECGLEIDRLTRSIDELRRVIDFFEAAGRNDKEVEIRYASTVKGLHNGLKNFQGKLEGMNRVGLLARKASEEEAFLNWARTAPDAARHIGTLAALEEFLPRYATHAQQGQVLGGLVGGRMGPALLAQAFTLVRAVNERQKPDLEREEGFQERNIPFLEQRIRLAERGYDLATDRAFCLHVLTRLAERPETDWPQALRGVLADRTPDALAAWVDNLYDRTRLADPEVRLGVLRGTPQELADRDDPMLNLARALEEQAAKRREPERALGQERRDLRAAVIAGRLERAEGRIAPDANSTIRFTMGPVKGYRPRDAVEYLPLTSLGGVMEKRTDALPFLVPDRLVELHRDRDFGAWADPNLGDVVTCFLNTVSVTGGNSGSPTLNARGEQVGIVFDMTYESVVGDYLDIPEYQRTISVDMRYVLFVVEKFAQADWLLREMGL